MIDPATYRESIANMDVEILEIESLIMRMEKCVKLKSDRNMVALIESLTTKRDTLVKDRCDKALKLFRHYRNRNFTLDEIKIIIGRLPVERRKNKRPTTRREHIVGI